MYFRNLFKKKSTTPVGDSRILTDEAELKIANMLLVLMKEAQNIGSLRKSDPFRFSELNERDKELIDMTKQL